MNFNDWKQRVEQELICNYGINFVDIGFEETQLANYFQTWPKSTEFVEWFALKFDLDRLPPNPRPSSAPQ